MDLETTSSVTLGNILNPFPFFTKLRSLCHPHKPQVTVRLKEDNLGKVASTGLAYSTVHPLHEACSPFLTLSCMQFSIGLVKGVSLRRDCSVCYLLSRKEMKRLIVHSLRAHFSKLDYTSMEFHLDFNLVFKSYEFSPLT